MIIDGARLIRLPCNEILDLCRVLPFLAVEDMAYGEVLQPVVLLRRIVGASARKLKPVTARDVNKIAVANVVPIKIEIDLRPHAKRAIAHREHGVRNWRKRDRRDNLTLREQFVHSTEIK